LIARQPTEQRQGSRLLFLDGANNHLEHEQFGDFLTHIESGDLIVFNNTKSFRLVSMAKSKVAARLRFWWSG